MASKNKKTEAKARNWLAVHAHFRRGGRHDDERKATDKSKCRQKVSVKKEGW